jgi:hypothetical protein
VFDISKLPAKAIDLLRRIRSGEYALEQLFDQQTLDLLCWRALPCPPLMKTDRDGPWLTYFQRQELLTPEGGLTDLGLVALEIADAAPPADTPPPLPPKGRLGRRGYSREVLNYARELRKEHQDMKVRTIMRKCKERFPDEDMPDEENAFRTWLNRRHKRP